jgi:hypothetical protein
VTDAELEDLKGLTNPVYLHLSAAQVTDTGRAHLEGMTQPESLSFYSTHVTDAGVKKLQDALPDHDCEGLARASGSLRASPRRGDAACWRPSAESAGERT